MCSKRYIDKSVIEDGTEIETEKYIETDKEIELEIELEITETEIEIETFCQVTLHQKTLKK